MLKSLLDLSFALTLFLGSIYLWFVADAFPEFARYQNVDSDFWPKILSVVIALLSLSVLCQSAVTVARHVRRAAASADADAESQHHAEVDWKRLAAAAGLVIAYYFGLRLLGFLAATILFLAVAVNLISYRNTLAKAVFPFAFTAAMAALFVGVLSLPLPRGVGIFHDLSLWFY